MQTLTYSSSASSFLNTAYSKTERGAFDTINDAAIAAPTNKQALGLADVLPIQAGAVRAKKIGWDDFKGSPNYDETWNAHVFWYIKYNFAVEQYLADNKKVRYNIDFDIDVKLSKKSWVKNKCDELLSHEQGHYIIGCLCALEFQKRCSKMSFSSNFKNEIQKVFNYTLQEYLLIEKQYDIETDHRLNIKKQTEWDNNLAKKLIEYQVYFNKGSRASNKA